MRKKTAADHIRERQRAQQNGRADQEHQVDTPPPPPGAEAELKTTRLDAVRPEPVEYLVEGYAPLGKVMLLAGMGGLGKSAVALLLAARVSRGEAAFGLDYEPPPAADVLLCFAEDDISDTVTSRLIAFDADRTRIHSVDGVCSRDGKVRPFSLADCDLLDRALERSPGVKLVVIDPIGVFAGRTGINTHKESEVQALLSQLREIAERRRVTILLIGHLNKSEEQRAYNRISGSAAFINSCRAGFLVMRDEGSDDDRRLILPVKFNLGPEPRGLAYRTRPLTPEEKDALDGPELAHLADDARQRLLDQLFKIDWLGQCDETADEVLSRKRDGAERANKVERCAAWLGKALGGFAWPSEEIKEAGMRAGFTFDNVKEAKALLGKTKDLRNTNNRFQGIWWTGFGDPAGWKLRPEGATLPTTPPTPETPHTPHSPHSGNVQATPM